MEISKLRSKLDRIRYKFEQQQKQRQNSQEMHRLKEENMLLKSQVHYQKQQLQHQTFQTPALLQLNPSRKTSLSYGQTQNHQQRERHAEYIGDDLLQSQLLQQPQQPQQQQQLQQTSSASQPLQQQQQLQSSSSASRQEEQQKLRKQLESTDMELVKIAQHKLMKENKSLKKRVDLMQGQMHEIFEILVNEKQLPSPSKQQQQQQQQLQAGAAEAISTTTTGIPPNTISAIALEFSPPPGDRLHHHHHQNLHQQQFHNQQSQQQQQHFQHKQYKNNNDNEDNNYDGGEAASSSSQILNSDRIPLSLSTSMPNHNHHSLVSPPIPNIHEHEQQNEIVEKVEVTKREFLKKIKDVFEKHQSQNDIFLHQSNQMKRFMDSKLLQTDSDDDYTSSESHSSQKSNASSSSRSLIQDSHMQQPPPLSPHSATVAPLPLPLSLQQQQQQQTPTALLAAGIDSSIAFQKKHPNNAATVAALPPPATLMEDESKNETTSEFNEGEDQQIMEQQSKNINRDVHQQIQPISSQQQKQIQPQQQQQRIVIPPPIDFTQKRYTMNTNQNTGTSPLPTQSISNQFSHRSHRSSKHEQGAGGLFLEVPSLRATFRGYGEPSRKGSEFRSIKEQYQAVLNSQSNGSISATNLNASSGYSSAIRRYDHLNQFQVTKHYNSAVIPSTTTAQQQQHPHQNNQQQQLYLNYNNHNTLTNSFHATHQLPSTDRGTSGNSLSNNLILSDLKRKIDDHLTIDSSRKEVGAGNTAGSGGYGIAGGSLTSRTYESRDTSAQYMNEKITDEYIKSIIQQYKTPKKVQTNIPQHQQQQPQQQPSQHHSNTKKNLNGTGIDIPQQSTSQQHLQKHQQQQQQAPPRLFSARESTGGGFSTIGGNSSGGGGTSSVQISPSRLSKPTTRINFQANQTATQASTPTMNFMIPQQSSFQYNNNNNNNNNNSNSNSQQVQYQQQQPLSSMNQLQNTSIPAYSRADAATNSYNCYFSSSNNSHTNTLNTSPINKKISHVHNGFSTGTAFNTGPPSTNTAAATSNNNPLSSHNILGGNNSHNREQQLNMNHKRQQSCGTSTSPTIATNATALNSAIIAATTNNNHTLIPASSSTTAAAVAANKFNLKLNLTSLVNSKQYNGFQSDRQYSDRPNYTRIQPPPPSSTTAAAATTTSSAKQTHQYPQSSSTSSAALLPSSKSPLNSQTQSISAQTLTSRYNKK